MTKYTKPEINIEEIEAIDIICTSGDEAGKLEMWGLKHKTVDADTIKVFE